jgi:hypothetical protein
VVLTADSNGVIPSAVVSQLSPGPGAGCHGIAREITRPLVKAPAAAMTDSEVGSTTAAESCRKS